MYNRTVLNNKLAVITKPMRHVNSLALGIWIKVGGRFEKKSLSGISHFLEHMVFKGTKTRSADAIKRAIEGVGGTLNGFTAEECTCYWAKALGKYQNRIFAVLADMVLNPKLSEKEMEKERTVILEEIKMYKDLPNHYVHELLDEILWPGHPLSMPLTGDIGSVSSMSRKDLFDFNKRYYSPNNIAIVAVGAVDEDTLAEDARRFFSSLSGKQPERFKKADLTKKSDNVKLHFKETEQTHMAIGIHALSRFDRDRYALAIINIILGANMSSRLFTEVREKRGLAYEIASHVKEYQDAGLFSIDAGVDNKRVKKAFEVIVNELTKLKQKPVGAKELERAKEFYKGQFLMMVEGTLNYMIWMGDKVAGNDSLPENEEILKKIEEVTPEDIKRVANRIFKSKNLKTALIGPQKEAVRKDIGGMAGSVL